MERNYNYNRTSSYLNRYSSKHPKSGRLLKRIDKKFFERMANQFIAASVIALAVIIMSNIKISFVEEAMGGIRWVVGTNYDFNVIVNSVIPGVNDRINEISGALGGIFGDDKAVDTVSKSNPSIAILPVDGEIISGFNSGEKAGNADDSQENSGIDIKSAEGTPIKAALDGVVLKIEEDKALGRLITIKHENGLETVYAHCSEILVDKNQDVKQGNYIAKVGKTGTAAEPHLYFEVLKDGTYIDPLTIIGSKAEAI